MTNKTDAEILSDAPDAKNCVVDVAVNTKKSEVMYIKRNARGDKIYRKGKGWNYLQGTLGTHWVIRSLADIEAIVERDEKIAELEADLAEVALSNAMLIGQIAQLKSHLDIVIQAKSEFKKVEKENMRLKSMVEQMIRGY